ncbi:O-antigen ligase domain-containing protein [Cryobacterium sandaracinum]|uniref:O-antigen ligase domain-containing protein n=1 Tax=Cryobacterium sandaracinum TaxID=1259247 RepID=A0ABY2JH86_9MICO|nr:O-antigen ligase family protein [Cryobacterium sandaracinum]TFD05734.1 O-antigen ligase domain-containing protein [Cryobacterium sandaracinum]
MPAVQSRFVVRTFATLVFFSVLAGQFWRSLFGWWGYGAIALVIVVSSVVALVKLNPDWMWSRFPKSLIAFLGLATLSLAWSFYLGASLIGVTLQWATTLAALFLALCLSWAELLRTLAAALRWILALSLAFELIVALFVRQAVLPFWVDYGTRNVPESYYWTRGILLQGGPIEGIVANRNLLGFVALMAVIVFAVQLAAGTVSRNWGLAWLGLGAFVLLLTRSATVTLAAAAVAAALLFALWARRRPPEGRRPVYLVAAASVVVGGVGLVALTPQLLALLGKSADLTGRLDIWRSVAGLAAERPVFGWGWVSYWAPWVEPFEGLAVRRGVVYLQAHNAWLDVWLQLGVLGLIIFAAAVFSTLWRCWFLAVDRPRRALADTEPYAASALLPLLLLVALIAQSLAESRILIESGWLLLVVLAVITKRQQATNQRMP